MEIFSEFAVAPPWERGLKSISDALKEKYIMSLPLGSVD